jgi:endo-alpha-1,4-polygalactosaminidase (GH114 family)
VRRDGSNCLAGILLCYGWDLLFILGGNKVIPMKKNSKLSRDSRSGTSILVCICLALGAAGLAACSSDEGSDSVGGAGGASEAGVGGAGTGGQGVGGNATGGGGTGGSGLDAGADAAGGAGGAAGAAGSGTGGSSGEAGNGTGGAGVGGSSGAGGSGTGGASVGGSSGAGGSGTGGAAGKGGTGTGGASGKGGSGTGGSGTGGSSGAGGSSNIWHPGTGTSWQWQLTGTIDTSINVAMYDIDLFDASSATITTLHNAGRIVICYFSAGSREDWRPDAGSFAASDYGKALSGWAGENWLDVRSQNVRTIMKQRLDLAVTKNCDGVEPDNVDGYANSTGFPLTQANQVDYNTFLATEAHARGLSVGLKNAVDLVQTLEPSFDWALNEECLSYDECSTLQPFVTAGKAVFHVEYVDTQSQGPAKLNSVCGDSTITGFSTLIKLWDLDAWRLACP